MLLGIAVAVCAGSLLLPLAAVSPQDADSSEFVAVALRDSLAHPPGFPWFSTLLGPIASFSDNPYAALGSFNAVAQACATGLLAILVAVVAGDVVVGALLALSWVLWGPTLYTGTMIEVFAVHHIVVIVLVLVCRAARAAPTPARLVLVGVVAGVGGSHHPTIVFFAPWVLAAAVGTGSVTTRAMLARLCCIVVGAAIGLLPYALLPLRFAHDPFSAFGHVETFADIVHHALRMDYGVLSMNEHETSSTSTTAFWSFVRETRSAPLVVLGVAVLSLGAGVMRWRAGACRTLERDTAPALATWLFLLGFAVMLRSANGEAGLSLRFFPTIALGALLAVAAVLAGFSVVSRRAIAGAAVAVALPFLGGALRAADAKSDGYEAELLAQIFSSLPAQAILLVNDDGIVFGAEAEQARGVRPDVTVVAVGRLDAWWTRERLRARHPFLADVDINQRSWVAPLAEAALRAGRVVAAAPTLPLPSGISARVRGPVTQWTFEAEDDEGLLSRCRALPSSLAGLSAERTASWAVARRYSLFGLAEGAATNDPKGRALARALAALAEGDVAAARKHCAL